MKLALVFLFLITFASGSWAADKWTRNQVYLEVTWQVVNFIDWGQTLNIADDSTYYDYNPILGRHPSRESVNLYFGLSAILHPVITHYLPSKYRKYWFWGTIGLSSICVINNHMIGLSFRF